MGVGKAAWGRAEPGAVRAALLVGVADCHCLPDWSVGYALHPSDERSCDCTVVCRTVSLAALIRTDHGGAPALSLRFCEPSSLIALRRYSRTCQLVGAQPVSP